VGGNRHRVDRWGRFRFESFSFDVRALRRGVSIHMPITAGRLRRGARANPSDAEHTSRPNFFGLPSTYHPNQIRLCPTTSPVESSLLQLGCMASRNFADQSGVNWHVWNTVPVSGAVINPGFEKGWLTFEAETGLLRRLAPVPEGWEDLPSERLLQLLEKSKAVPRHTGPMHRVTPPTGFDRDASDPA